MTTEENGSVGRDSVDDADDGQMEIERDEEGAIRIDDIYIAPPPLPACTFDATGPRLVITAIENDFFKSYAGKEIMGPFHKNFTSIIGPNGSGKSNVIDAMLFVFGYRAQKIRAKKVSTLIHKSSKFSNVQSCSVAIHFAKIIDVNEDDFTLVPDSEFVISRTAFQDNSSYYRINGNKCNLKEVSQMLRTLGIDIVHNRFLILQGDVEQISLMKPKAPNENDTGMLEYLEDIIGSDRFKEPIALLLQRVDQLNEQRGEKLNRVKIAEKDKNELEGAKNEAVEYLNLENEIVKNKHVVFHYYMHKFTILHEEMEAKKLEVVEGAKNIMDEFESIKEKRAAKDKQCKLMSKEFEALTKDAEELKTKFGELEKKDVGYREDLKHGKAKGKKLVESRDKEQNKIIEYKKVPEKTETMTRDLNNRKGELEKDVEKYEKKLSEVMATVKPATEHLQKEKEEWQQKLLGINDDLNQAKAKMDLSVTERDVFMSREQQEKTKLDNMKRRYGEIVQELTESTDKKDELEGKIPVATDFVANTQREVEGMADEIRRFEQEIRADKLKIEEAQQRNNAARNKNRVSTVLSQEKAEGRLNGFFGRLGDLGAIDPKYDVAISTACPQLDNFVVDTIETAQDAIKILKEKNAGVSTFIALDKMQRWTQAANSMINTPQNVPRLFDLVQVKDNRLLPAFYFALRDTLVAETLNQATDIGLNSGSQRYRVVTLNGDLIETSGTMSGGGRQQIKGKMGNQVASDDAAMSPTQIGAMQTRFDNKVARMRDMRQDAQQKSDRIESTKRDLGNWKHTLEMLAIEIKGLTDQEATLKKQIADQEVVVVNSVTDQRQVAELQKKVDQFTKEYDDIKKKADMLTAEIEKVDGKIVAIKDSKVKPVQQKFDEAKKMLEKVCSEITKGQVALKTAERNLAKSEKELQNIEKEIEANGEKMEELKTQSKQVTADGQEVMDQYTVVKGTLETATKEYNALRAELTDLQSNENKLKEDKLEVDHKLEKCDAEIRDAKGKVGHWKKSISKLVLQSVDGETAVELEPIADPAKCDEKKLNYEITVLEEKLKVLKPTMSAIAEYKKKEQQYLDRVRELDDLTTQRDRQRKHCENLRKQRLNEFMAGFAIISTKLKEMYQMLTLGGDAELDPIDKLDPFSEGIEFSVRPPRKSWKSIGHLSGGEKTLSSLALVFALHYYKPTPFYVMDEIDAALDFRNVSIVANYIKDRTKNAQFIVISLRDNMFELANYLVGIYKTHDCTHSVTIDPRAISQMQETPKEPQQGGSDTTQPQVTQPSLPLAAT